MSQAQALYQIVSQDDFREIELPRKRLVDVFGLAEQGDRGGALEVYFEEQLIGSLWHAQSGFWEIDWHSHGKANFE